MSTEDVEISTHLYKKRRVFENSMNTDENEGKTNEKSVNNTVAEDDTEDEDKKSTTSQLHDISGQHLVTESDMNDVMEQLDAATKDETDVSVPSRFDVIPTTDKLSPVLQRDAQGKIIEANRPPAIPQAIIHESKRMGRVSFSSWGDFDTYFELYLQDTYQPFRVRSTCTMEAYKRVQAKRMKAKGPEARAKVLSQLPDEAVHHHRIYMCTHAMLARHRGKYARKEGQKYRGIGCLAKINVKITASDSPNKYLVIVTDQNVAHNHAVGKEIYEAYPDHLVKKMKLDQMTANLSRKIAASRSLGPVGGQLMLESDLGLSAETAGVSTQHNSLLVHPPLLENPLLEAKFERILGRMVTMAETLVTLDDNDYDERVSKLEKWFTKVRAKTEPSNTAMPTTGSVLEI